MPPAADDAPRPVILSMKGIRKSYESHVVLDGVDLDIRAGERVALIGPSGSGKTTILRLAVGLVRPEAGTIRIEDKYLWHREEAGRLVPADERHARVARRPVGMVFQQFNLFPHMTALQNVREPLMQVKRVSRAQADSEATALLTEVGLADHLGKRPVQLSGGQQQRVAIARSLALKPRIMLFDEVTSALDPELVGEVLQVLRRLARASDMAMLIVTHEITFAADIADRVLMFDKGRIIEDGPPDQVIRNPRNPRTQLFLRAVLER
jgi:polar amino acid transport system ATP-binding protein